MLFPCSFIDYLHFCFLFFFTKYKYNLYFVFVLFTRADFFLFLPFFLFCFLIIWRWSSGSYSALGAQWGNPFRSYYQILTKNTTILLLFYLHLVHLFTDQKKRGSCRFYGQRTQFSSVCGQILYVTFAKLSATFSKLSVTFARHYSTFVRFFPNFVRTIPNRGY